MFRKFSTLCLQAMRADFIPKGENGLWYVDKLAAPCCVVMNGRSPIPPGNYTVLMRHTRDSELTGVGETVMSDEPHELRKHLDFIMRAFGDVLVTGLGLACVVRGLQANRRVKNITVVERDRSVIDLVWSYTPHGGASIPRIELVQDDAMGFCSRTKRKWDCAWHDLWSDEENGELHLAVNHQRLMLSCCRKVKWQGAWHFPRHQRRAYNASLQRRGYKTGRSI